MPGFLVCENPFCGKTFQRREYKISKHNYCSHSCAVTVNNKTHVRNPGIIKVCEHCGKYFKSRQKYCSRKCKDLGETISESKLISQIKQFEKEHGRIPYKNEFRHCSAARNRFGTWNKAIKKAGFKPNPVKFANKYIANDGNKCDSLAEKLIEIYPKDIFPLKENKYFPLEFLTG